MVILFKIMGKLKAQFEKVIILIEITFAVTRMRCTSSYDQLFNLSFSIPEFLNCLDGSIR